MWARGQPGQAPGAQGQQRPAEGMWGAQGRSTAIYQQAAASAWLAAGRATRTWAQPLGSPRAPCVTTSRRLGVPPHAVLPLREKEVDLSEASPRREAWRMDGPRSLFGSLGAKAPLREPPGQVWAELSVETGWRAPWGPGEASGCSAIIPGAKVSSRGEGTQRRALWARSREPAEPCVSSRLSHARS